MECKADKMREKIAMLGWLTPLYLVCVYVSLKLLLCNIFFFAYMLDFSVTNCLCHVHIVMLYKKSKFDHQNPLS